MKRREKKYDIVIWEAVRVFHDKTIEEAKCMPPELCTTPASKIVLTNEYVYLRHPDSDGVGSWTIIPYSLVKKIVKAEDRKT